MTLYKEHIKINKNFQSSINLELDLENERKIMEYIPTTDICDVLKRYLNCCLGNSKEFATTLVGPYGKGKSFLLLTLTYILNGNNNTYRELLRKINQIDPELVTLINEYRHKHIKLLPIVVNATYDKLNQSFLLALNEALTRAGLQNIIPNTAYDVCLELLDKWEKDKKGNNSILEKCLSVNHITLRQLRIGLKEYDRSAYEKFEKLYNCVSIGLAFNPLVTKDIIKTYISVNNEICSKKYKYSGMFIIFDEFSKYIDNTNENLMRELAILQGFAEECARSTLNNQMHLCCVTHKSLYLYSDNSSKADALKTVAARFKEVKFNRSLEENYQIIGAAIQHYQYTQYIDGYIKKNKLFYDRIMTNQVFRNLKDVNVLIKGCFPLNPMTVYALIQLSEIVAQNERTIFTFISDTDDNSLNSFIQKTEEGTLFNVDKIYDYFSPLLMKEESNDIRNLWYRAEGTLSHIDDPNEKKVLKALAVLLMINDNDRLPATVENISLSIDIKFCETDAIINKLINNHYIRKNVINNLLSFANSNNKEIEEQINVIKARKAKSLSIAGVAEEINQVKYVLPRRYNEQNKITRFYSVAFITENQFLSLHSFEVIENRVFSDGLILNVLCNNKKSEQIKNKIDEIDDAQVIVRLSKKTISSYFIDEAIRYAALNEILSRGGNDDIVTSEISLLLSETESDIRIMLDDYFGENCQFYNTSLKDEKISYKDALSNVMDNIFTKKIVFNNELINKESVTTQYQKSINNVINWILAGKEEDQFTYSETSPENTIRITVLDVIAKQSDVKEIIKIIKNKIEKSENERCGITSLTDELTKPPYGIRRGILPLLIAIAISELSDNVILYLQKKEIELTAQNIVKSVSSVSDYYFGCLKGSKDQTDYLFTMLSTFKIKSTENFRNDTKLLFESYRKFFVGLPTIMRHSTTENNYLGIPKCITLYMSYYLMFNINPYEVVYENLKLVYKTYSYKQITNELVPFISDWNQYLIDYKVRMIKSIDQIFNIRKSTSLKMGLSEYLQKALGNEKVVLSEENMKIKDAIEAMTYDNYEACEDLALATIGTYIEDWTSDHSQQMIKRIQEFKDNLTNAKKLDATKTSVEDILKCSESNTSQIGALMMNSLKSVFDEYGNSISNEEKIVILSKLIQKYL